MKIDNSDHLISISEKCESLKDKVVNRVEKKCVQSIRADIKEEALANDCKEEFVFPAFKTKGVCFYIAFFNLYYCFFV